MLAVLLDRLIGVRRLRRVASMSRALVGTLNGRHIHELRGLRVLAHLARTEAGSVRAASLGRLLLRDPLCFRLGLRLARKRALGHTRAFRAERRIEVLVHENHGQIPHLPGTKHAVGIHLLGRLGVVHNPVEILHELVTRKIPVVVEFLLHLFKVHGIDGQITKHVAGVFGVHPHSSGVGSGRCGCDRGCGISVGLSGRFRGLTRGWHRLVRHSGIASKRLAGWRFGRTSLGGSAPACRVWHTGVGLLDGDAARHAPGMLGMHCCVSAIRRYRTALPFRPWLLPVLLTRHLLWPLLLLRLLLRFFPIVQRGPVVAKRNHKPALLPAPVKLLHQLTQVVLVKHIPRELFVLFPELGKHRPKAELEVLQQAGVLVRLLP